MRRRDFLAAILVWRERAGADIALITPMGVGGKLGIGWAAVMDLYVRQSAGDVRFLVDCDRAVGDAMAAARRGIRDIVCVVEGARHRRLGDILAGQGTRLWSVRPACFDWAEADVTPIGQQRLIRALDQWYSDAMTSSKQD